MSYYKVKSFSFSKDFRSAKINAATNNIRPLWYNTTEIKAKENETTFDFVYGLVNDFLSGGLQFNDKKHYINYVIESYVSNSGLDSLYTSPRDFGATLKEDSTGELERDFEGNFIWVYPNKEKEQEYNIQLEKIEQLKNTITNTILNGTLKKDYNEAKKEKYYLIRDFGYPEYVCKNTSSGFYRTSNINYAKVFNGLDVFFMKDSFIKTTYNFDFVKIERS